MAKISMIASLLYFNYAFEVTRENQEKFRAMEVPADHKGFSEGGCAREEAKDCRRISSTSSL
jgi:hypothetical protein